MFVEQSYYYIGNLKLTVHTHTSLPPGQILEIKYSPMQFNKDAMLLVYNYYLPIYLSIYIEREREMNFAEQTNYP